MILINLKCSDFWSVQSCSCDLEWANTILLALKYLYWDHTWLAVTLKSPITYTNSHQRPYIKIIIFSFLPQLRIIATYSGLMKNKPIVQIQNSILTIVGVNTFIREMFTVWVICLLKKGKSAGFRYLCKYLLVYEHDDWPVYMTFSS